MRLTVVVILLVISSHSRAVDQLNRQIDSLRSVVNSNANDTTKIKALRAWDDLIYLTEPKTDSVLLRKIMLVAQSGLKKKCYPYVKIFFQRNYAWACNSMGIYLRAQEKNIEAIQWHLESIKWGKKCNDIRVLAASNNNLGSLYEMAGKVDLALKSQFNALKYWKTLKDESGMATTYFNLGVLYTNQNNKEAALDYLKATERLYKKLNATDQLVNLYNSIGVTYYKSGDFVNAEKYFRLSLVYVLKYDNKFVAPYTYMNLGNSCFERKDYDSALYFHSLAYECQKSSGVIQSRAAILGNIGSDYMHLKNLDKARAFVDQSLKLALEGNLKEPIVNAYLNLAKIDSAAGDFKNAYLNYKLYVVHNDSIINEENTKQSVQAQMQHEFDKKSALKKAEQDKKDALAQQDSERQFLVIVLISGVLFLVAIFSFVIFRNLRYTKLQKTKIEEQKKIVEHQKALVEEKQLEIIDSINYAKRIQTALLPGNRYLDRHLNHRKL